MVSSLAGGLAWSTAAADSLRLKGWLAGESTPEVCAPETARPHQDLLAQAGLANYPFPASGCEITVHDVAGLVPSERALLLFWKGRLARAVIRIKALEWEHMAALRTAFIDLYGAPEEKRTNAAKWDRWRRDGVELAIEWTRAGKLDDAAIFLTHGSAWAEYERERAAATAALDRTQRARRARSVAD